MCESREQAKGKVDRLIDAIDRLCELLENQTGRAPLNPKAASGEPEKTN